MDTSSSQQCDLEQFQKIYEDLLQLGSHDHERIIINTQGQQHVPCTAKKSWLDFTVVDAKSSHWILKFLDNHLDNLVHQEHADHLFLKLEPCFEGIQKQQFNKIHQIYFNTKALIQSQNERLAMFQEAEKRLHEIENLRLQEIESRAHDTENKLKQEIETRAHAADDCLKKKEESIQELEVRLARLKKENTELEDTLLVCKDGEINCHMKILEKSCFFKATKKNIQNGMKKSFLTQEEQKNYAYKFEFKDLNFKTLDVFIKWINSPQILKEVVDFDELCELYRLADYLNDISFQTDCLAQLKKQLNKTNVFKILSTTDYSIQDGLIKLCCNFIIKNFKHLSSHAKFYEIIPEYFLSIIQNDHLHVDHEEDVFKALISWADAQAKLNNSSLKDILNTVCNEHRILEGVRFENFHKESFISQVLPLNVLSAEEANQWLTYYLKEEIHPNPRFYSLQFTNHGSSTAKITWNVPVEDFISLGEWNEESIISESFMFNNNEWAIQLGKDSDNLIIGIVVQDSHTNFDYFLEINKIRFYSAPTHQSEIQIFHNNGKEDISFIKGVHFDLKTLKENLDVSKQCIPLKIKIFIKD